MEAKRNHAVVFQDERGQHVKYFGATPATVALEDFRPHELFMTVNHLDVIRGLHFQVNPAQPKLLTCVEGAAVVNVVCLDPEVGEVGETLRFEVEAPTFEAPEAVVIHVPPGHGLGYRILQEGTKMLYLAGADFNPAGDLGVDPLDGELGLDWGPPAPFILSSRDKGLPSLEEHLQALEGVR